MDICILWNISEEYESTMETWKEDMPHKHRTHKLLFINKLFPVKCVNVEWNCLRNAHKNLTNRAKIIPLRVEDVAFVRVKHGNDPVCVCLTGWTCLCLLDCFAQWNEVINRIVLWNTVLHLKISWAKCLHLSPCQHVYSVCKESWATTACAAYQWGRSTGSSPSVCCE